jgi:hypothetical protein
MQWSGFVEGIFCCNLTSAYGGGGGGVGGGGGWRVEIGNIMNA